MKRRNFLKGLLGVSAVAVVPAIAQPVKKEPKYLVDPDLFPNLKLINNEVNDNDFVMKRVWYSRSELNKQWTVRDDMARKAGEHAAKTMEKIMIDTIYPA